MKVVVGWTKTEFGYGRPKFCGDEPHAGVELSCPDDIATDDLRKKLRQLFMVCRQEAEQQAISSRPSPREPGDDEDDIQPGDSAYERSHQSAPARPSARMNGHNNGTAVQTRPSARPSSRPSSNGHNGPNGQKNFGPPKNPSQLLGWLNKQGEQMQSIVYSDHRKRSWELSRTINSWNHEGKDLDAVGVYEAAMKQWNGNGQH